jgi:Asp-tRNA(Asn)/Glu-tRNA(Gln) amidotransferase A subunit family amidase
MDREDVLKQARASTRRIKEGRPLSVFDGVPVAVKDEVDMLPYPTTVGTAFLGDSPCKEDSTVVARMRSAGALLIGKANCTRSASV